MTFDVLMAVSVKTAVFFRDVTHYIFVDTNLSEQRMVSMFRTLPWRDFSTHMME